MAAKLKVEWSLRAVSDLDRIYKNLMLIWTSREANLFLDLAQDFENLISRYPNSFPLSKKRKGCRLGLIHKNVSAVYLVKKETIYIVTLFHNRTNSQFR